MAVFYTTNHLTKRAALCGFETKLSSLIGRFLHGLTGQHQYWMPSILLMTKLKRSREEEEITRKGMNEGKRQKARVKREKGQQR